ncbi:MAG: hypothetical protein KGY56_07800, partial [Desulfobacterales bacterium]|nr:hypothetical protein [Desulfobacterales bacterium]
AFSFPNPHYTRMFWYEGGAFYMIIKSALDSFGKKESRADLTPMDTFRKNDFTCEAFPAIYFFTKTICYINPPPARNTRRRAGVKSKKPNSPITQAAAFRCPDFWALGAKTLS